MSVNGREPWMSQVISSKTVSNMLTVTKRTPRPLDGGAHPLAPAGAHRRDVRRRQQVGNLEVLGVGVGVEDERVVLLAEVAGVLAVGHVAPGAADGLGEEHVGGDLAALALEVA